MPRPDGRGARVGGTWFVGRRRCPRGCARTTSSSVSTRRPSAARMTLSRRSRGVPQGRVVRLGVLRGTRRRPPSKSRSAPCRTATRCCGSTRWARPRPAGRRASRRWWERAREPRRDARQSGHPRFWATWCMACRMAAPRLSSWQSKYGAQGLAVIGITDDPIPEASQGASSFGMNYADRLGRVLRDAARLRRAGAPHRSSSSTSAA